MTRWEVRRRALTAAAKVAAVVSVGGVGSVTGMACGGRIQGADAAGSTSGPTSGVPARTTGSVGNADDTGAASNEGQTGVGRQTEVGAPRAGSSGAIALQAEEPCDAGADADAKPVDPFCKLTGQGPFTEDHLACCKPHIAFRDMWSNPPVTVTAEEKTCCQALLNQINAPWGSTVDGGLVLWDQNADPDLWEMGMRCCDVMGNPMGPACTPWGPPVPPAVSAELFHDLLARFASLQVRVA